MRRELLAGCFLLVACKKEEAPFHCFVHVEGGVDGAILKLGDTELGVVQHTSKSTDPEHGDRGDVRCAMKGMTRDEGHAKVIGQKATLLFATPCGPKEIPLDNTSTKSWLEMVVPVAARATLPKGLLVYSDAPIDTVKIGSATMRADTSNHVETPSTLKGNHVGWVFDASCAPKAPIEVGGKATGELDTTPLAKPAALGNSIFVPSDPAKCFESGSVGYGDASVGRLRDKLTGAPGYILERAALHDLMQEPPASVAADRYSKLAFRYYVMACP
jgi:hypothetical protein